VSGTTLDKVVCKKEANKKRSISYINIKYKNVFILFILFIFIVKILLIINNIFITPLNISNADYFYKKIEMNL
jgi:ABC-type xylose transport system permease subunit